MAGQVVSAVLARAASPAGPLEASGLLTQFRHDGSGFVPRSTAVAVDERPPMATVPEYRSLRPGSSADVVHGTPCRPSQPPGRTGEDRPVPALPFRSGEGPRGRRPSRGDGGGARAHPGGLPPCRRDRRGRRGVRRPDDPGRRAGLRARPADRAHLQRPRRGLGAAPRRARAVPLRRPQAGHARAGGPTTRSPRSPTSPTSRTAWSSPSTGCSSTSPPRPARCGWRSRPSTRPGTPARSRRRWSSCSPLRAARQRGPGGVGRQARRPDDELLPAGRAPDGRPRARHAHRAADRQAAAAGPAGAAERQRDRRRPRHLDPRRTRTSSPTRTPPARRSTSGR